MGNTVVAAAKSGAKSVRAGRVDAGAPFDRLRANGVKNARSRIHGKPPNTSVHAGPVGQDQDGPAMAQRAPAPGFDRLSPNGGARNQRCPGNTSHPSTKRTGEQGGPPPRSPGQPSRAQRATQSPPPRGGGREGAGPLEVHGGQALPENQAHLASPNGGGRDQRRPGSTSHPSTKRIREQGGLPPGSPMQTSRAQRATQSPPPRGGGRERAGPLEVHGGQALPENQARLTSPNGEVRDQRRPGNTSHPSTKHMGEQGGLPPRFPGQPSRAQRADQSPPPRGGGREGAGPLEVQGGQALPENQARLASPP